MTLQLPASPSFRVDGQRALVTGAGRGIGLASAVALARAGAHVTLLARSAPALDEACALIRAEGGACDHAAVDVTDAAAVDRYFASVAPFHILVNSAGLNRPKPLVEASNDDVDAVLDLNVKATLYVTRAAARGMLAAQLRGSIITVSSQMGVVGSPRRTLYCASKHAVEGMTKALAWELGPSGIRVNTVCPTFIETAMTADMLAAPGFRDWVIERIALRRVGRISEVMGAIVFLSSEAASLVTGSALMLDGGWSAA